MKISKIYFDMDGVLADFERGLRDICGMEMPDQAKATPEEDDKMWKAIKDAGHFYDMLEPMPGALKMYEQLSEKYECAILSAVPKPKREIFTAGEDKIKWVRRIFSDTMEINIVLKEEKKEKAKNKSCVLIDDLLPNIEVWESCGGTGIQFTSADDVLKQIAELENEEI